MTHPSTLTADSRVQLEARIWAAETARRHLATITSRSIGRCFGVWTATLEWEQK